MTATVPTGFAEADFQTIRADLQRYLSELTEFRDFNFDGSAMNLLLCALAYTANYMAIHSNLSLTEVFEDSCQLRASIVSHAKALGYFPRQTQAARARLSLSYTDPMLTTGRTDIYLPEGARFSAGITSQSYEFVATEAVNLLEELDLNGDPTDPGTYVAEFDVREGTVRSRNLTYPRNTLVPIFRVLDKTVDTDYFKVQVTNPGDTDPTEYFRATDFVEVDDETRAFFLQEGMDEAIEFYFGDSVIGAKPALEAAIAVSYLSTQGPAANGVSDFDLVTDLEDGLSGISRDDVTVTTVTAAAYGAEKQDIDSIRFTAPKAYAAQERAVTEGDYQALLLREFGFIETLSVWGGEKNDPPLYGKVLVSIKPVDGTVLSPAVKADIQERVLDVYSVVGLIPQIVDPDYTYVDVRTTVNYERERSTRPESEMSANVREACQEYFQTAVTKFNSVFRFSNLVAAIDDSDSAILGNETSYTLAKRFTPIDSTKRRYEFRFGNELAPGTLSLSTSTVGGGTLTLSDSNGRVGSYLNGSTISADAGTIDYDTGLVVLRNFSFDVASGTELRLSVSCANQDVVARTNNLVVLDRVVITMNRFYRSRITGTL